MIKKILEQFLATILAFLLVSCVTASIPNNMTATFLTGEPSVAYYQEPNLDLSSYETFFVLPYSSISKDSGMNEIMERQILFTLRNEIAGKGYKFVEPTDDPDFIATIKVTSEYKERYVPPSTITLPMWVPGKTITSFGSTSGRFNYNTYGSNFSYGSGNFSGSSMSSTYIPGYMTTQSYTRPGYTEGSFFPSAIIHIFDVKTQKQVWYGTGVGSSKNPDARVSIQTVINYTLAKFPLCSMPDFMKYSQNGAIGALILIRTNDGNNYFPTVFDVKEGSPADKAGLKKFDMIYSINGRRMCNLPTRAARRMLSQEPGTFLNLEVLRLDKKYNIKLNTVDRSKIY